jgi:hypothetical protein
MDTVSVSVSANLESYISTEIKMPSNIIKAGTLALGIILSSNQMPASPVNVTANTLISACIDGSLLKNGVYSNVRRHNYAERYKIITESEWFQKAYKDKSLGQIIGIDI